jgi:hypothetical protein
LHLDQARSILDGDYYPPARKGDIYRIKASGVETIILIDGVFHAQPTVWHREILDAMESGIRVVGASSMGALRAAELHVHGMIGFGKVFEWYRDGIIDGDDEVAILHGLAENHFRPLSEALVNIRFTIDRAIKDRCLEAEAANKLATYASQLYYPDRSYRRLLESPILKRLRPKRFAKVERYFSTKSVDIKRLDAIGVLQYCTRVGTRRKQTRLRPQPACPAEEKWWDREKLFLTGFIGRSIKTGAQVLAKAREDHKLIEAMQIALSKRRFLLEWARQNAVSCPERFREVFVRRWEQKHRMQNRNRWLRANGLTRPNLLALLAERALVDWINKQGPGYFGLKGGFISEWANQNGIKIPLAHRGCRSAPMALEDWIVKCGPEYFGLDWNFEKAFVEELQVSGKAAELAAKLRDG